MDAAHDDLDNLIDELRLGRPLEPLTTETYDSGLHTWWAQFAAPRGLPTDATTLERPLRPEDVEELIYAAYTGELRRNTRAGARADQLAGRPLAPPTLAVLLSALRRAHLAAGHPWCGNSARIRDLVRGYEGKVHHAATQARPITPAQVRAMLTNPPHDTTGAAAAARLRAVASQLRLPLPQAGAITPDDIIWNESVAHVVLAGRHLAARCLRTVLIDPIHQIVCAHCVLGTWMTEAETNEPLASPRAVASTRQTMRRSVKFFARGRLTFMDDQFLLTHRPESLWTIVALALPGPAASWLRARAMLLLMLSTGLRLADLDKSPRSLQRLSPESATLTVYRKQAGGEPTDIPLQPTHGPLCPVSALWTHDQWVRAFIPDRRQIFPPARGKNFRYPVDVPSPPASRATYSFLRTWLLHNCPPDNAESPRLRSTVTPHSARRTFAQAAARSGHSLEDVQHALGHARPTTTRKYLTEPTDAAPTARVLEGIAQTKDGHVPAGSH